MKKISPFLTVTSSLYRFLCYALLLCFPSISLQAQKKQANVSSAVKTNVSYTHKIIKGNNSTFGYDIYVGKKLRIHQPSIPAHAGNEGFKTKTGAEKVAQLVIKKMKMGEMPPTISIEDIKKLKAI